MLRSVLLVTLPFCFPGINTWSHTEVGVQAPQQGLAETPSLDLDPWKGRVTGCSSGTCLVYDAQLLIQRYLLWVVSEPPPPLRIPNTLETFGRCDLQAPPVLCNRGARISFRGVERD